MAKPRMHLAFDISYTHLDGRWRMPGSWTGRTDPDLDIYEEIARIAERGRLDMLFFGDGTGIPATWEDSMDEAVRWGISWPRLDKSAYIACMSRVTKHVGFGLTYASTFMHPFYVARLLNSLDHVTGGRLAFNVITSTRRSDAANYGFDELMEHDRRYDRMEEFVDVCKELWDGWADDAVTADAAGGLFVDPAKVRKIDHKGQFFSVKGALDLPRSPQGWPVLVQAGGSPAGLEFAAMVGEVIFAAQGKRDEATKFRNAVRERMPKYGRDPELLRILPGLMPIIGATEAEALEKEKMLNELLHPAVGIWMLSQQMDFRLYDYPEDGPLPTADIRATGAAFTPRVVSLMERADREGLTVHQCGVLVAASRSHGSVVGTPEQIADHMQSWLDEGA